MEILLELGLPGLVFVGLCVWLVRKAARAARTESDLEGDRLRGALADELREAKARAARASEQGAGSGETLPSPQEAAAPGVRQPAAREDLAPSGGAHLRGGEQARLSLAGADVRGADPAHLALVSALVAGREAQARAQQADPPHVPRRVEVLWVRSNASHAVWCERRHPASPTARALDRDVICVALIERGAVVDRWSFG